MALRDKIAGKIAGAFVKLDDIPVDAIVKHKTGEAYDPAVQKPVPSYDEFPAQAVLDTMTEEEVESNVAESDKLSGGKGFYKAIVQVAELKFFPVHGDKVVIDSENYFVTGGDTDPARIVWTGYLYKIGGISDGLV